MKIFDLPIKHAVAAAALCLVALTSANAALVDVPTISLSGPDSVPLGDSFTMSLGLDLPQNSAPAGVTYFTATISYFPVTTPPDFIGHVPLELTAINPGSLLSGTEFSYSFVEDTDPREQPQAAVVFTGSTINAPASGELLSFQFRAALDGVGAPQNITVAVDMYDGNYALIPLDPASANVNIVPPTNAVPEASTAVLIAAGLLLVVFGRRKLKLNPQH